MLEAGASGGRGAVLELGTSALEVLEFVGMKLLFFKLRRYMESQNSRRG